MRVHRPELGTPACKLRVLSVSLIFRLGTFITLVMFSASAAVCDDSSASSESANPTAKLKSFLDAHCISCHQGPDAEAGVDLSQVALKLISAEQGSQMEHILDQLHAELMPPLSEESVEPALRSEIIRSLETTLMASEFGEGYRRKRLLPAYGNHVDHELLFSGEVQTPAFSPARLWRRSPYAFEQSRRVGKVKGIQNPFTFSTPASGIRDYADANDAGSSVVETILLNANAEFDYQWSTAEERLSNPPQGRRRPDPFDAFVDPNREVDAASVAAAIGPTFRRLVFREPTPQEVKKYVGLYELNFRDSEDRRLSLQAALTAIYLSPEAIFRMEWGLGEVDQHGRRRLSPDEIAHSLSWALFDHGPYDSGRAENSKKIGMALESGRLETAEDVARVVEEILESEPYRSIGGRATDGLPRIPRFFREYFGYHHATEVFKDARRVREHGLRHDPRRLVTDADNLIKIILRDDQNVIERLLTTPEALVFHDGDNQRLVERHKAIIAELEAYDEESVQQELERRKAGILKKPKYKANPKLVPGEFRRIERLSKSWLTEKKKQLAELRSNGVSLDVRSRDLGYIRAYNFEPSEWQWPSSQPLRLPEEQRAGLLTHPAWLIAHSTNDGNDPIHRGIWVYEKLLAGVMGDVPPTVDARIPSNPHQTLRERMSLLRQDACWKCHRKVNPIGEAFEVFDDFGRHRRHHYFDAEGRHTTRTVEFVLDDEGREVGQRIDLEQRVRDGLWTLRDIDASGSFDEVGIPELSGDFDDAIEMIHQLGKTDRVRQSFIRHLFRYLMGRNELLSDSATLIAADRAYVESGGSFRALVVSLLSSDSFLYRK